MPTIIACSSCGDEEGALVKDKDWGWVCAARHARQPKSLPNGIQHNWVLGITNTISPFRPPMNPPPKRP